MDTAYQDLARRILTLANANAPNRILVGVAGPPGSGKSTVMEHVVNSINVMPSSGRRLQAVGVSLDGFHYTRAQLDTFDDPIDAHRRRGAPWTFDVPAILEFIHLLQGSKTDLSSRVDLAAPTFDHAVKDPVAGGCIITAAADIVVLDGNYVLYDQDGWRDVTQALDFRVFIHVEDAVARVRVAKRHVFADIEPTLESGEKRYDSNDGLNAKLIREHLLPHDFEVKSV